MWVSTSSVSVVGTPSRFSQTSSLIAGEEGEGRVAEAVVHRAEVIQARRRSRRPLKAAKSASLVFSGREDGAEALESELDDVEAACGGMSAGLVMFCELPPFFESGEKAAVVDEEVGGDAPGAAAGGRFGRSRGS
jgi:hypothetical protein